VVRPRRAAKVDDSRHLVRLILEDGSRHCLPITELLAIKDDFVFSPQDEAQLGVMWKAYERDTRQAVWAGLALVPEAADVVAKASTGSKRPRVSASTSAAAAGEASSLAPAPRRAPHPPPVHGALEWEDEFGDDDPAFSRRWPGETCPDDSITLEEFDPHLDPKYLIRLRVLDNSTGTRRLQCWDVRSLYEWLKAGNNTEPSSKFAFTQAQLDRIQATMLAAGEKADRLVAAHRPDIRAYSHALSQQAAQGIIAQQQRDLDAQSAALLRRLQSEQDEAYARQLGGY
jgi:hypothetical protein